MRHKLLVLLSIIVIGISLLSATVFFFGCSQTGKKVLLIYDLEGVTGATQPMDVSSLSPRYPAIRESLTEDVNSAIKGLQKAGASEIVLTDAHGSGNPEPDYILEKLPDGARFDIRDYAYDAYIDTLDESFDAVVCIGMHSGAGRDGFLAHTYYGHTKWIMAGYDMNETMLVAGSAARFGIPVIFVSGDNVLKEEVAAFSPKTEFVVVKEAKSLTEAESRTREDVSAEIQAATERALRGLGSIPAWNPPELANSFENLYAYLKPQYAALAMDFPGAKAVNDKTVSIRTGTFLDAYLTYRLLCNYTATSRFWQLTQLISEAEGGPEILKKVSAKMEGKFERSFEPTGETIDRSVLPPRGKHGYQ